MTICADGKSSKLDSRKHRPWEIAGKGPLYLRNLRRMRERLEDEMRIAAFRFAWQRLYADVDSNSLRFCHAIAYSAQPANVRVERKRKAHRLREILSARRKRRARAR